MNQIPALMISENFENRSNRICLSDYISPLFYCPIKMIRRTVPMIPVEVVVTHLSSDTTITFLSN